MRLNFKALRIILLLFLFLGLQNCTKDLPDPVNSPVIQESNSAVKYSPLKATFPIKNLGVEHKKIVTNSSKNNKLNSKVNNGAGTNLLPACYDIYDVYYNLDTGEEIGREYVGTRCDGGDGGSSPYYPPGGGGGGPTGGGGGTGTPSVARSVDSDLPSCADQILSNLRLIAINRHDKGGLLSSILASVGNSNSSIALHFEVNSNLPLSTGGDCRYTGYIDGKNDFIIRLNDKYLNGQTTDLFIAQILLHETLHAALIDWGLNHGRNASGATFDSDLAYWLSIQNINTEQGQHDAMSVLVDQLGQALYDYYLAIDHSSSIGGQYLQYTSFNDCVNLCWTGLENTVGYQVQAAKYRDFRNQCDVIHGAEKTGSYKAIRNQDGSLEERYPAGNTPCK